MADSIAGHLVRDGVRVIGRAATVRQDSAAPEFERIGQEQGVRFVLGGRVTRGQHPHTGGHLSDGDRLRRRSQAARGAHSGAMKTPSGPTTQAQSRWPSTCGSTSWRRFGPDFQASKRVRSTRLRSGGASWIGAIPSKNSRAHVRVSSSPPPRIRNRWRRPRAWASRTCWSSTTSTAPRLVTSWMSPRRRSSERWNSGPTIPGVSRHGPTCSFFGKGPTKRSGFGARHSKSARKIGMLRCAWQMRWSSRAVSPKRRST